MEKRKITYKNSCFVDETIVNKTTVIYGAVFLNNLPSITIKELSIFIKNNIYLIRGSKKKMNFLKEVKSTFFTLTNTTEEAKKRINRSEIRMFKKYKSSRYTTEIENRDEALSKLIKKVQCKWIYIDHYGNGEHRRKMIALGKRVGKNVVFIDSTSESAIQLADILLKLHHSITVQRFFNILANSDFLIVLTN